MTDFIKVENLVFDYIKSEDESTFRAIDDVSFTVEKGSFTAIIGQNGSGKSTLAKNINGLLVPTAGKIYVDGLDSADPENIWEVRQRVAMVFQNPDNQIVSSVVEDDVAFGPENLGVDPKEIRKRVDECRDVRISQEGASPSVGRSEAADRDCRSSCNGTGMHRVR